MDNQDNPDRKQKLLHDLQKVVNQIVEEHENPTPCRCATPSFFYDAETKVLRSQPFTFCMMPSLPPEAPSKNPPILPHVPRTILSFERSKESGLHNPRYTGCVCTKRNGLQDDNFPSECRKCTVCLSKQAQGVDNPLAADCPCVPLYITPIAPSKCDKPAIDAPPIATTTCDN